MGDDIRHSKVGSRGRWKVVGVVAAVAVAAVIGYWTKRASAEGPPTVEPLYFAGMLSDTTGDPLPGSVELTIRLFDAAEDGTEACSTDAGTTALTAGHFRVALAPECAEAVAANPDLWVEVHVGGDPGGTTLPRTKLGAVPYALEAGRAVGVTPSGRDDLVAVGQTLNCRIALDGTTLSVVGRDGEPLSADNVCIVGIDDEHTASFDAPVSVSLSTEAHAFGSTTGRAWAEDRPFFLAACHGSDHDYFGFSLNPIRGSTGSAICPAGGGTHCGTQDGFLVMDGVVVPADEANRPCVVVGSFRARKSDSDIWTPMALERTKDGFGHFQEGVRFTMPLGQNGAAPGHYLAGSSGASTVPSWPTGVTYRYWVNRNGTVRIVVLTGEVCTPGAGAEQTLLALPYVAQTSMIWMPAGWLRASSQNEIGGLLVGAGAQMANLASNFVPIRLGDWSAAGGVNVAGTTFDAFAP